MQMFNPCLSSSPTVVTYCPEPSVFNLTCLLPFLNKEFNVPSFVGN